MCVSSLDQTKNYIDLKFGTLPYTIFINIHVCVFLNKGPQRSVRKTVTWPGFWQIIVMWVFGFIFIFSPSIQKLLRVSWSRKMWLTVVFALRRDAMSLKCRTGMQGDLCERSMKVYCIFGKSEKKNKLTPFNQSPATYVMSCPTSTFQFAVVSCRARHTFVFTTDTECFYQAWRIFLITSSIFNFFPFWKLLWKPWNLLRCAIRC